MTPLINTKITSNTNINEDGGFSLNTESTRFNRRINSRTQVQSNRVSQILGAFFHAGTFLKITPIDDLMTRNYLNQSISIEERIRTKITLIEAKRMALNSMKKYNDSWSLYLKDEGNRYYSINDF